MTLLDHLSDDDLLRRCGAGEEDAFTALYRRRQGGIYRFAAQMSGSPSVAEEVTQEAFMTLIREARRYEPSKGSVGAFLYGIARNHVLRCLERDGRYVPLGDPDGDAGGREKLNGAGASNGDLFGDLARRETVERVRQAVLALPPKYREVVALCDLEELEYAEAALALGCELGTVRSRLHRARALLVAKLRAARSVSVPSEAPARRVGGW